MTRTAVSIGAAACASKQRLRVWLRLLKLQRQIEAGLRDRLRTDFDTTLPRFDVMSALNHHEEGLRMSELSSFLKVSNGNVTGIIDRLVQDGKVVRVPVDSDRRALLVRLTNIGVEEFAAMAKEHEAWLNEILDELTPQEATDMIDIFDRLSGSIGRTQ